MRREGKTICNSAIKMGEPPTRGHGIMNGVLVRMMIPCGQTGYNQGEVKRVLIQVVGLNHQSASLAVRERVGLTPDLVESAYKRLHLWPEQQGVVILSTCNRTEIYVAGSVSLSEILGWWESLVGVERGEFSPYLFWYQGDEAVDHLFSVAAGLDSLVIGETQILGQVKDAYLMAHQYNAAGRLHRLFHYALRVGKRAHSETGISHNALSVGHTVVELARKVFGDMTATTALIVGSGEMGTLVARHLAAVKPERILVTNRTMGRAEELARAVGGEAVPYARIPDAIRRADVIVSCTSARGTVIRYQDCREALKGQTQRLRFFFDLAVPRDIDPAVSKLGSGVFLYDMDDVKSIVESNLQQRQREAVKVQRIVREERETLNEELGATEVGPVIRSLREKAEAIRQSELSKALNRLPNLSEKERLVVADTTRVILNKFLNDAMVSMRSWGPDADKALYIQAIRDLFRLNEEQTEDHGSAARSIAVETEL